MFKCDSYNDEDSRSSMLSENMVWIRIILICTSISLLQAHKECTRHIHWDHLIQSLNSMVCVHNSDLTMYFQLNLQHELNAYALCFQRALRYLMIVHLIMMKTVCVIHVTSSKWFVHLQSFCIFLIKGVYISKL